MNLSDRYAVFGFPIKHSKSPQIHALFAQQTNQDISYEAQEVKPEDFKAEVARFFSQGGKGINCTLPLKELAWELAEQRTERAEYSGAVNTLVMLNGKLLGDNTDGSGLLSDLIHNQGISISNIRILVLGAGGATRGIIGPLLSQQPSELVIANRTPEKAIRLAQMFSSLGIVRGCGFDDLAGQNYDLILNATSASLTGDVPPLPPGVLAKPGYCYDLAYASQPTAFVKWGQTQLAQVSVDGLGMLVEQAAEAFYLWRGIHPATKPVIELIKQQMY